MGSWVKVEREKTPTWKPEKEGDEVKGVLTDKQMDVGKNKSKLYTIENDDKEILVWGSAGLDPLMKNMEIGGKIHIRFLGMKVNVSSGRKYKSFEVFRYKE